MQKTAAQGNLRAVFLFSGSGAAWIIANMPRPPGGAAPAAVTELRRDQAGKTCPRNAAMTRVTGSADISVAASGSKPVPVASSPTRWS